jgi:pimeloyl-ACP methyl ester carboxylesterase
MSETKLSYIKEGKGIPVLFQHGLGANKAQSKQLLGAVDGIQLIAFDAPGHGDTILPKGIKPSFDYYTDLAISLLDKLEISTAIFGGISMGSGISVNAALRYPDRVRGLLLVRPAWLDRPSPGNLEILIDAAYHIETDTPKEFQVIPEFKRIQEELPAAADSILGVFDPSQQDSIAHVLRSMVNSCPFSSLDNLGKIKKPCMIIGSDDDPLHPYSMAEILHENVRGSSIHKVISRYINDPKHKEEIINITKGFIEKL